MNTAKVVTAGLVVVGVVSRWAQLGTNGLWFDEGYTAWVVSHPAPEVLRLIQADTAPPGHYLLLREWVSIFGSSETALRSMSAAASTLALAVFWRVAVRLLKDPAAVAVAVGVYALGYMQVGYAHEARFYSLMALAGVCDFYLVLRLCEKRSVVLLAATALCWAFSLYLNNVMAIYLAAVTGAWAVLPGARAVRGRLVDGLAVTAAAAAAFSVWVPTLVRQARAVQGNFWLGRPTAWLFFRAIEVYAGVNERSFDRPDVPGLWHFGRFFDWMQLYGCYPVAALLLIGAVYAAVRNGDGNEGLPRTSVPGAKWRTTARPWRLPVALTFLAVAPATVVFFYSLARQSIFMDRAFEGGSFAVPLLVALPVAAGGWRPVVWAWVAALGLAMCPATWSQRRGERVEDWRPVCAAATPLPGRRQLTVFNANEGELLYDYYVRGGDYSPSPDMTGTPGDYFDVDPPHTMRRALSDGALDGLKSRLAAGGFDDVVLVSSHAGFTDPAGRTRALLDARYRLVAETGDQYINARRYRAGGK